MASRVGYFGNPDGDNTVLLWNEEAWNSTTPGIVTCIKKNSSATYGSPTAKYPSDNQVIKLDSDEYVTGISFNGNTIYNMNPNGSRHGCFAICDSNGGAVHLLNPWDTMVPGDYGSVPASVANKSGQNWTDLAGKTIALGKMQGDKWAIYWRDHRKVTLTTDYLARTITTNVSGPGTFTLSSSSLKRNQTANLTLTPTSGYKVGNVVASAGTLTRTSPVAYTFTMPQPAQNITLTITFSKIAYTAVLGGIIYADWYNQE